MMDSEELQQLRVLLHVQSPRSLTANTFQRRVLTIEDWRIEGLKDWMVGGLEGWRIVRSGLHKRAVRFKESQHLS